MAKRPVPDVAEVLPEVVADLREEYSAWKEFTDARLAQQGVSGLVDELGSARRASAELEIMTRTRRDLIDATKITLAAGVSERRTQLLERQGEQIATLLRLVLVGAYSILDVSPSEVQQQAIAAMVRRTLQEIADTDRRPAAIDAKAS